MIFELGKERFRRSQNSQFFRLSVLDFFAFGGALELVTIFRLAKHHFATKSSDHRPINL